MLVRRGACELLNIDASGLGDQVCDLPLDPAKEPHAYPPFGATRPPLVEVVCWLVFVWRNSPIEGREFHLPCAIYCKFDTHRIKEMHI